MAKLKPVTPQTKADHTYQNDVLIPSVNELYDTVDKGNGKMSDFVVDYGTNNKGSWEKWNSGKIIQWGIYRTNDVITEDYGVLYRSRVIEINYPLPIKTVDSFSVTSASGPNNFIAYVQGAYLTVMHVRAVHVVKKLTKTDLDTAWQVIGTWK